MYLKIKKQRAEEVRKRLIKSQIYDTDGRILQEEDFVLLPVKKEISINGSEIMDIPTKKINA